VARKKSFRGLQVEQPCSIHSQDANKQEKTLAVVKTFLWLLIIFAQGVGYLLALVRRLTSVCNENGTRRVGQRKTWIYAMSYQSFVHVFKFLSKWCPWVKMFYDFRMRSSALMYVRSFWFGASQQQRWTKSGVCGADSACFLRRLILRTFFVGGAEEIVSFFIFFANLKLMIALKFFLGSFVKDSLYWHSIELFYCQRFVFASLMLHSVCKI